MIDSLTAKGVFVAALVLGLAGCGPSAEEVKKAGAVKKAAGETDDDKASAEIAMLGGTVGQGGWGYVSIVGGTLDQGRTTNVSFEGQPAKITDAGLEHLQRASQRVAPTPDRWTLSCTQITDAGLEHLKGLTQLQTLHLTSTKVTDAGLEHLKGLTQLKSL